MTLKAYYVDSMPTIYAAESAEEAARLYLEDIGDDEMEAGYPYQVAEEELDRPTPEFDEDEQLTGEMTTMRAWLEEASPGHLCGCE